MPKPDIQAITVTGDLVTVAQNAGADLATISPVDSLSPATSQRAS